jgi:hypothetical protein
MNWLKKGPELKLSELRVPGVLEDLFYDLKDRHLLPLVALLIVAIIGAPIYFKNKSDSESEPVATPTIATGSSVPTGGNSLVVARSTPGLRDYRRRLRADQALDPFRAEDGEQSAETETSTEEGAATPVAPEEATVIGGESSSPEIGGASTGSEETASPGAVAKTQTRFANASIDVRVVTLPPSSTEQKAKKSKPRIEVRRDLPELTMLPARSAPAATFMGISNDGKKALFLVSSDVLSIFGEGICVIGSETCQLIALEPNLPETFIYGPQERTYRIELLKIDQTYSAKPRRAALGTGNGKKHSSGGGGKSGSAGTGGGETTGKEPAGRGDAGSTSGTRSGGTRSSR